VLIAVGVAVVVHQACGSLLTADGRRARRATTHA